MHTATTLSTTLTTEGYGAIARRIMKTADLVSGRPGLGILQDGRDGFWVNVGAGLDGPFDTIGEALDELTSEANDTTGRPDPTSFLPLAWVFEDTAHAIGLEVSWTAHVDAPPVLDVIGPFDDGTYRDGLTTSVRVSAAAGDPQAGAYVTGFTGNHVVTFEVHISLGLPSATVAEMASAILATTVR